MANKLKITYYYKTDGWIVESEIDESSDADFPRDVFLWTVADDGSLDTHQVIAHIDQVARYPLYDSDRTNNFGIHLVRANKSYKKLYNEKDRDDHITVLKSSFNFLIEGYGKSSKPVEEIYP